MRQYAGRPGPGGCGPGPSPAAVEALAQADCTGPGGNPAPDTFTVTRRARPAGPGDRRGRRCYRDVTSLSLRDVMPRASGETETSRRRPRRLPPALPGPRPPVGPVATVPVSCGPLPQAAGDTIRTVISLPPRQQPYRPWACLKKAWKIIFHQSVWLERSTHSCKDQTHLTAQIVNYLKKQHRKKEILIEARHATHPQVESRLGKATKAPGPQKGYVRSCFHIGYQ